MYKEKGRKVDCSDWDFEEPQVRIVEYAVCIKKDVMVVLSPPLLQKKAFKSELDWFDVAIYKPTNILSEKSE